ncbi:MAG: hypothetical protein RIT81_04990 [Deltaproteobacteria bacterium]
MPSRAVPTIDFFISYSGDRRPRSDAERLVQLLVDKGATVFADFLAFPRPERSGFWQRLLGLSPVLAEGEERAVREGLVDALAATRVLIVIWERGHAASPWCRWEVETFRRADAQRPIWLLVQEELDRPPNLADARVVRSLDAFAQSIGPLGDWRDEVDALEPAPPRPAPDCSVAWWTLLFDPRRWAEAVPDLAPGYTLVDVFARPKAERAAVTEWTKYTLGAPLVLNLLALLVFLALGTSLTIGDDLFWYQRHLVLSAAVSIVGGLVMAAGIGVGAGGAAALWAGVAAYGYAALAFQSSDAPRVFPGAVAAAVLVGSTAAHRVLLSPLTEMPRVRWPTVSRWMLLRLGLGVLLGGLVLESGLVFREALIEAAERVAEGDVLAAPLLIAEANRYAGRLDWASLAVESRALFGGVVGAVSGLGLAASVTLRTAFASRQRQAKWRGALAALATALVMTVIGALLAAAPATEYGELFEGGVLGVLTAFVAVAMFTLPSVFAGLGLSEPEKATWGVVGAALLASHVERLLGTEPIGSVVNAVVSLQLDATVLTRELSGIQLNLTIMHRTFLFALLLAFVLQIALGAWRFDRPLRPIRVRPWTWPIVSSLGAHVVALLVAMLLVWPNHSGGAVGYMNVRFTPPGGGRAEDVERTLAEQWNLEAAVAAGAESIRKQTEGLTTAEIDRLRGRLRPADFERVVEAQDEDQRRTLKAMEVYRDLEALDDPKVMVDRLLRESEDVKETVLMRMSADKRKQIEEELRRRRVAAAREAFKAAHGGKLYSIRVVGNGFELRVAPGTTLDLAWMAEAGETVQVRIRGDRMTSPPPWGAKSATGSHKLDPDDEVRVLRFSVPSAHHCRVRDGVPECEDANDNDYNEPRLTRVRADPTPL